MSNQPPAGMAVCPICRSNGIKTGGTIAGLSTHLEEHAVKDVIAALARETITAQHGPEVKPPAECPAHGEPGCDLCSLNPGLCEEGIGECDYYRDTGMHWDTCPNRIRSYEKAVKRLIRSNDPDLGPTYQFAEEATS